MTRTKEVSTYLNADTLMRAISIGLFCAFLTRFIAFARGILMARTLDPFDLGLWALTINAIQIGAYVVSFGIPSGLCRYVNQSRAVGSVRRLIGAACGKVFAIAVVLAMAVLFFSPDLGSLIYGQTEHGEFVALALAGIVTTVAFFLAKAVLQGLRLFRTDAVLELLYNCGFLVLLAVLFAVWRRDAIANAWAYLSATLLTTAAIAVTVHVALSNRSEEKQSVVAIETRNELRKKMAFYSMGAWTAGSLQIIWRHLDRYMLLHFGELDQEQAVSSIGDYFIASRIAEPVGSLAVLVGVIVLPHAVHLWEENRREEVTEIVRLSTKLAALLLTLAGAVLAFFKGFVLWIVVGRTTESASLLMAPVTVTVIGVAIIYILKAYLLCRERVWLLSMVWCLTLLVNIALNLWFIPRLGIYGAILATLVSAMLALFCVLWLSVRDGFDSDLGLCIVCALPVALLLPWQAMLFVVSVVVAVGATSNVILSEGEKRRIMVWFSTNVWGATG